MVAALAGLVPRPFLARRTARLVRARNVLSLGLRSVRNSACDRSRARFFFMASQGTETMKPRKSSRSQNWQDVCGELREGDGVDPRLAARQSSGSRHHDQHRKTGQLCQQVAHVVEAVLNGEAHDDDLQGLSVVSVVPAPHTGRLLVTVMPWDSDEPTPLDVLQEKLRRATPWLRSELATSISRRKVPELVFQVVWSDGSDTSGKEVDHA